MAVRAADDPAARPLPSESDGTADPGAWAALPDSRRDRRRSRRGLLRHGGIVRLRARALRRVETDRRAKAVARCARDAAGINPRRLRRLVPPAGEAFHRRRRVASGRAPAIASEQHRALSSVPPVTALIYFTAG